MRYIYTTGYILSAVAMQLFTGNFPVSFLVFPLNIIFAANVRLGNEKALLIVSFLALQMC